MNIKNYKELIDMLSTNDNVTILQYVKKDNTSRDVNCTLNFDIIPTDDFSRVKNMDQVKDLVKKGIICVYDNDKKDWRSLLLNKIKNLEIEGQKYTVGA